MSLEKLSVFSLMYYQHVISLSSVPIFIFPMFWVISEKQSKICDFKTYYYFT